MKVRIEHGYEGKDVRLYKTEVFDEVAGFASALIERWGLVAAMPDGEDSSGRARLRLPTTDELVKRAFDIAEATFAEAAARSHVIPLPDLNEINADIDARRADAKDRLAADVAALRKGELQPAT